MRLDQWLWAVRVYKSRTLAPDAIKAGQVRVNGHEMKASHEVRAGEVVAARVGTLNRTLRVLGAPPSRIGAKLVPEYAEDLTPQEEYARQREERVLPPVFPSLSGVFRPMDHPWDDKSEDDR
jgi:ribosome-associated heat shock protein Hsp15